MNVYKEVISLLLAQLLSISQYFVHAFSHKMMFSFPGDEDAEGESEQEETDETETGEDEEDLETAAKEEVPVETNKNDKPEEAIQPTATQETVEEMERTITGTDGLRSVIFDGTTLPLDDEPVVAATANLEVSASMLDLSPSIAQQSMTATPPLETQQGASQATQEVMLSDRPEPSASEVPNNGQTQATEETAQQKEDSENPKDDTKKLSLENEKNETLQAPGEGHIPTPAWDSPARGDDPYTPGDFVSRRFLQSDTVDTTPEMKDNMKNEETEEELEKGREDGQEENEEHEEEEKGPSGEERPEPEGQEDPSAPEEEIPENVTPTIMDDDPMPPFASEEDTAIPTPPTPSEDLPTEEETSKEGSTGIVGNFVSAIDGALQIVDPLVGAIIGIVSEMFIA